MTKRDSKGRFPKNTSGNPSGRPKMDPAITAKLKELTLPAIKRLAELMRSDNEPVAKAACDSILDRSLGKPVQGVSLANGDGDRIASVTIEFVEPKGDDK